MYIVEVNDLVLIDLQEVACKLFEYGIETAIYRIGLLLVGIMYNLHARIACTRLLERLRRYMRYGCCIYFQIADIQELPTIGVLVVQNYMRFLLLQCYKLLLKRFDLCLQFGNTDFHCLFLFSRLAAEHPSQVGYANTKQAYYNNGANNAEKYSQKDFHSSIFACKCKQKTSRLFTKNVEFSTS